MITRLAGICRGLQAFSRMGNMHGDRRQFLRGVALTIATGAGLASCDNKPTTVLPEAPQKTQAQTSIPIKYVDCSADYPLTCILNCEKDNPSVSDIFEALRYLDTEEVMRDYCFSALTKKPDSPTHLRAIIQQGNFKHFYLASQYLAQSDSPLAKATIQAMVQGTISWERELGSLLLASKTAKDPNEFWPPLSRFATSFFRHPEVLDELIKDAQERFFSPYTIWEIGSSAGLTAESMRIALTEETLAKVKIIGTDISPFSLIYAARGQQLLDTWSLANTVGVFIVHKKEMSYLEDYARSRGWNINEVLARHFYMHEEGALGPIYEPKKELGEVAFAYDDITDPNSVLPDNSVDAVVYANVHCYLGDKGQRQALAKIRQKLKPGGKLLFINTSSLDSTPELINVFGQPIKEGEYTEVFVK